MLVQRKEGFLGAMTAAQVSENHEDEWGLIFMNDYWQGIYTSIPAWTNSQIWVATTKAQSLHISSPGTSLKWSQRLSQSARNSLKLCHDKGHPPLSLKKSQCKIKQQHKNFPAEQKPL